MQLKWQSYLYLKVTEVIKLACELACMQTHIFFSGKIWVWMQATCEQALGGMEGERKEEGQFAHLKFYCSAPFLTFL